MEQNDIKSRLDDPKTEFYYKIFLMEDQQEGGINAMIRHHVVLLKNRFQGHEYGGSVGNVCHENPYSLLSFMEDDRLLNLNTQ